MTNVQDCQRGTRLAERSFQSEGRGSVPKRSGGARPPVSRLGKKKQQPQNSILNSPEASSSILEQLETFDGGSSASSSRDAMNERFSKPTGETLSHLLPKRQNRLTWRSRNSCDLDSLAIRTHLSGVPVRGGGKETRRRTAASKTQRWRRDKDEGGKSRRGTCVSAIFRLCRPLCASVRARVLSIDRLLARATDSFLTQTFVWRVRPNTSVGLHRVWKGRGGAPAPQTPHRDQMCPPTPPTPRLR